MKKKHKIMRGEHEIHVGKMKTILETKALTKTFKGKNAVNAVNMHVEQGDIYGFIGKNGAGKTTLMKMICGMITPTKGSFTLFGSNNRLEGRKKIGCVIEQPALYPGMTAQQNLTYYAKMMGCYQTTNINEILNLVGLPDVGKKKAKKFSLGMKQRLSIAIALLGDPEFLILDEPINGLDPAGIKEIRELLLKLNEERKITILISSHILGELGKIATKYGIINEGVLVEEFPAEELENRSTHYIRLVVNDNKMACQLLETKFGIQKFKVQGDNSICIYEQLENIAQINTEMVNNHLLVSHIAQEGQDMEMYFVDRMGGM